MASTWRLHGTKIKIKINFVSHLSPPSLSSAASEMERVTGKWDGGAAGARREQQDKGSRERAEVRRPHRGLLSSLPSAASSHVPLCRRLLSCASLPPPHPRPRLLGLAATSSPPSPSTPPLPCPSSAASSLSSPPPDSRPPPLLPPCRHLIPALAASGLLSSLPAAPIMYPECDGVEAVLVILVEAPHGTEVAHYLPSRAPQPLPHPRPRLLRPRRHLLSPFPTAPVEYLEHGTRGSRPDQPCRGSHGVEVAH